MMMRSRLGTFLILLGLVAPALGQSVPSPEAHLGYKPGADFRLADWETVVDYVRKVDAASPRVVVQELGKTTEGRPYLVAVVASEKTIAELDRYKAHQKQLSHPIGQLPSDFRPGDKPVALITCSIHSSETASTLMAMELLHGLATKDDPETKEILDKTILLLVPSANPDGVTKVARWYEQTKGKPWEGEGMPELYHKYAGHDTNRDWFMLNLKETQLLTRLLYKEWFPTLSYDVHQMGSKGARIFVPPFFDPLNPNLDSRVSQSIFLIGAHMASDLASAGKKGVLTNAMYDNWWNGGNRTTPQRHNIVGVLTESASVKLASPIFVEKAELKGATRGFPNHDLAVNFPDPWPGGWWRLRDIVEYQLVCARSYLTLAARYGPQFQANYLAMGLDSIRKGREEPPFAWFVRDDQGDQPTTRKMLKILHDSGIEVRRAKADFNSDGIAYPAGTFVLRADQPYRSHLKDMMERQVYPTRLGPGGAAEPPYDVAGWTLPLQMGVKVAASQTPVTVEAELLDAIPPAQGSIARTKGDYLAFTYPANVDFIAYGRLLKAGVTLKRASGASALGPVGTVYFDADAKGLAAAESILPLGVRLRRVEQLSGTEIGPFRRLRIALYQPWVPSMDEGWTRLVLENFEFPYTTVHDADIKAGALKSQFDVLILPSIPARNLREGHKKDDSDPRFVGGLGQPGLDAIREFVKGGGRLVCFEESCTYAIEGLDLPVKNVLAGARSSEFYAPGSIFNAQAVGGVDTAGVPETLSVYFDRSLAFEKVGADSEETYKRLAVYPRTDILESGWLLGPEKVANKAAAVKAGYGKGDVWLFGFPPQHRGQTHGTFRLWFNALFR